MEWGDGKLSITSTSVMPSNRMCGPVQICDFNLSDILGADGCITSGEPISPPWSAPERLSGLPFGTPADVFSFGVVLWELISLGAALFSFTWSCLWQDQTDASQMQGFLACMASNLLLVIINTAACIVSLLQSLHLSPTRTESILLAEDHGAIISMKIQQSDPRTSVDDKSFVKMQQMRKG